MPSRLLSILFAVVLSATAARAQEPSTDAAPSGPVVSASIDTGFGISTADKSNSLFIGAVIQQRLELKESQGDLKGLGFELRMARPQLKGTLLRPWVKYFVQGEFNAASARLLDLQVDVQPTQAFGIRIGQFVTPFSRAFVTPVPLLQFPDFSIANTFFRADRDLGVMIFGFPDEGRYEYAFGVFNGNGINKIGNDSRSLLYMARVAWNPLGAMPYTETPGLTPGGPFRLGIGLNVYAGRKTATQTVTDNAGGTTTKVLGPEPDQTFGVDLAMRQDKWMFQTEGYFQRILGRTGTYRRAWGGYAQGSYFLTPRLELAARGSVLDANTTAANYVQVAEVQVGYYFHGNHLKLLLRQATTHADAATGTTPQGWSNATTLQAQAWF